MHNAISSTQARRLPSLPFRKQAGFSLIEILVGLGIGMIGMVVMLNVFRVSEGYKRNTTNGDDARTAGAIAMYTVQRDLRQSGYNIALPNLLGCSLELREDVTLNTLAPIVINPPTTVVPAGDTGTDTLLIVTGNGKGAPEGDRITQHPNATSYQVATAAFFSVDDYVVAARAPSNTSFPCALKMEKISTVASPTITVPVGESVAPPNEWLVNLGDAPRIQAYAIRRGTLTVCDYMVNDCGKASTTDNDIWIPIADNIVSLRADYAKDTINATPSVADTFNQISPADGSNGSAWTQILAVRMVLVARSSQYDKEEVSSNEPTWAGSTNATPLPITLSGNSSWKHYRYKQYETIIPLRNLIN